MPDTANYPPIIGHFRLLRGKVLCSISLRYRPFDPGPELTAPSYQDAAILDVFIYFMRRTTLSSWQSFA